MNVYVDVIRDQSDTLINVGFCDKKAMIRVVEESLQINNYDFAIWLILPYAMAHGIDIEINLPVTDSLKFNNSLVQTYIAKNLKLNEVNFYGPFNIQNQRDIDNKSLLPFSGGVDSCFSLLYNKFELNNKIDSAFFGLGLDLFDKIEYNLARDQCARILALTETKLISIETDYRKHFKSSLGWPLHSDFVLAGLLHLFDNNFGRGLISGEGDGGVLTIERAFKYPFLSERLFFLFGNNFMTIDSFDGAYHSKIQKVKYISKFREVLLNLRVCWKSKRHFNCGKCPKCAMIQLAFLASNGEIPPCFPVQMQVHDLENLFRNLEKGHLKRPGFQDPVPLNAFNEILELSNSNGINHKFFESVKAALPRFLSGHAIAKAGERN